MDGAALRAACLAMPGAWEDFPFPRYPDRSVFKIADKVFAISTLDDAPLRVSLKCDPDLAVRLRADHPAIAPGYRLNKRLEEGAGCQIAAMIPPSTLMVEPVMYDAAGERTNAATRPISSGSP